MGLDSAISLTVPYHFERFWSVGVITEFLRKVSRLFRAGFHDQYPRLRSDRSVNVFWYAAVFSRPPANFDVDCILWQCRSSGEIRPIREMRVCKI